MVRYGFILMTICLAAALVLSFTYKITQARIQEQIVEEELLALKGIFPQADNFKPDTLGEQKYYKAESQGKLIGYVVKITAKGYSSDIEMLAGVNLQGVMQGIEVISQNETPGLGAKITEVKQGEKNPWFLKQFEGKPANDLSLDNIDAITAATITSEAVVKAVREKVEDFLAKIK